MMEKCSKYDQHRLDPILRLFGNPWVIVLFSVIFLIAGALLSIKCQDWNWFSRFGSLIAIAGLLLTMSPMLSRGIYRSQSHAFGFAEEDDDGNTQVTNLEDRRIGNAVFIGVIITITGALINAFGNLI